MLIDLTEILQNPYRTGIQRVEREIIKRWPKEKELRPIYFESTSKRFLHISKEALDILAAAPGDMDTERALLGKFLAKGKHVDEKALSNGLFNPELFASAPRSDAYQRLSKSPGANIAWLIYDFFPFLLTETNPQGTAEAFRFYKHGLSVVPRQCFISEQTRAQFGTFFQRLPVNVGPAFALGGDGLELEPQTFTSERNQFICLGSIDPRKNLVQVMKAFQLLWSRGVDARLTLVGHIMHHSGKEQQYILQHMTKDRRFKHLDKASDDDVRGLLRRARATIFVSTQEGYGLPPIESLAAGIPTIVARGLPSTAMLPPGGRITLDEISPEAIARAVERILDEKFAKEIWSQAATVKTPTWDSFVRDLYGWLNIG